MSYHETRLVSAPFDDVVAEVIRQLEDVGFDVLGGTDPGTTPGEVPVLDGCRRFRVIDTHVPPLSLADDGRIARELFLPSKVVVYENDGGDVVVGAADPRTAVSDDDPELEELAETVTQRFAQVLRSVVMETEVLPEYRSEQ